MYFAYTCTLYKSTLYRWPQLPTDVTFHSIHCALFNTNVYIHMLPIESKIQTLLYKKSEKKFHSILLQQLISLQRFFWAKIAHHLNLIEKDFFYN